MPVASSSVEMNVFVFAVDAGGLSANSGEAIRNMALAGHGSARLAIIMVGPDITAGRLIELLPDCPNPKENTAHAVFPSRRLVPPSKWAFADFLVEKSHRSRRGKSSSDVPSLLACLRIRYRRSCRTSDSTRWRSCIGSFRR